MEEEEDEGRRRNVYLCARFCLFISDLISRSFSVTLSCCECDVIFYVVCTLWYPQNRF